ncbi:hypothetical protein Poli38472_007804 [Pythium oligandrum]|uniref:Uncharacterized protein n=1 Tax=Pythium oligandrum TaxID=41045 RepID=A0A8K1FQN4_PYTOL|nr:hypothetical protein Poli38472_007804 [Pythium oligandrum]|eukprot:TMW68132.1 hypothetical protein Poli38472_007804 [Pythium oligandrum]
MKDPAKLFMRNYATPHNANSPSDHVTSRTTQFDGATSPLGTQVASYELSPMDAVMTPFGLTLVVIFPPRHDGEAYDHERLQSSLEVLVEEDYPMLMGTLHVDEVTGHVNVLVPEGRDAKAIPFVFVQEATLTTDEAVRTTPASLILDRDESKDLVCVKATLLVDGGLALGVSFSHALLDAEAFFTFMKTWGMHYRGLGVNEGIQICHDRDLLAPRGTGAKQPHPEFFVPPTTPSSISVTYPPTTQQRFHLTPEQLTHLKTTGTSPSGAYVSTIDTVAALFTILITQGRGHDQDVKITTGVNGRRRFQPPLPENYAGNVVSNALSTHPAEDFATPSQGALQRIAARIRQSIVETDESYMRDAIEFIASQGSRATSVQINADYFFSTGIVFTSWANIGMYDADFGARPWYCGQPILDLCEGFVVIMEGVHGTPGLDVLVFLECKAMEKLATLWKKSDFLC